MCVCVCVCVCVYTKVSKRPQAIWPRQLIGIPLNFGMAITKQVMPFRIPQNTLLPFRDKMWNDNS